MSGIRIISPNNLEAAANLLREGGVLIFPTETSYALGCDATNDVAVARVFAMKGRPEGKGTPLILAPDANASEFVEINARAQELIDTYWPGPLNIVAKRVAASTVSARCETDGTQSVRKSSHKIAAELVRLFGRPIVATSANKSGETAMYQLNEVESQFSEQLPDAVIDAGNLPVVPASTTVKIVDDKIEIVRQGSIVIS